MSGAVVTFGGDASGAKQAAQDAAKAVKESVDAMKSSLGSLGEGLRSLTGSFASLAAIVGGGVLFKSSISGASEWNIEVGKLAKQMGTTTEQASIMAVAFNRVGVDSGTVAAATVAMSRQLNGNESAFKTLGVATRDASTGAFLPMSTIMADANTKLKAIGNTAQQGIAGMQIYGRQWQEVKAIMKVGEEQMVEAEKKARDLHLIVGPEGVAMSRQYKESQRDIALVGKSLEVQIGNALLPVMVKLGTFMGKEGPAMGQTFALVLQTVAAAAQSLWLTIKRLGEGIGAYAAMGVALMRGDLAGAKAIYQANLDDGKNYVSEMKEIWGHAYDAPAAAKGKTPGGDEVFDFKGGKGGDKSRMSEWEADLSDQKVAYQKAHDLREMDKQDEIAYWRAILATKSTTAAESVAIRRKIAQTELEILKKQRHEEKALEEERIAQVKKLGELDIDLAREQLRVKKELGIITAQDELRGTIDLENQKYMIQMQALQDKIKLYELDKVARQKVLDEIEVLEREHAKNVKKINNDVLIEQRKDVAKWLEPITGAIEKSINGMIQGTLTLQKAISGIFQSIIAEFISMGAKKVASWIATEIIMTKATKEGVAARGAAEEEGSAAGLGTQMTTALKTIMNYAAEAFAGVWASLAGIPIVGPAMAAVEAPAAMAGVMGAASMLSARNGFDIPAGVNPLVQTHEKEMILPREQADVIRNMANGGGASGVTNHFHIQATDVRSFQDYLTRNSHAMAPGLRNLARNFTPSKA